LLALYCQLALAAKRPAGELGFGLLAVAWVATTSSTPLVSAAAAVPAVALAMLARSHLAVLTEWHLRALTRSLAAVCALSLCISPLVGWAYRGDRLQGVFSNPNSFGAACFFLAYLAMVRGRPVLLILAGAGVALSGSRSFLIATIIVAVAGALLPRAAATTRRLRRTRALVRLALIAIGGLLVALAVTGLARFLRSGDSARAAQRESAFETLVSSLPFGQGYSTYPAEASASLLLIGIELGVIGVALGLLAYAKIIRQMVIASRSGELVFASFCLGAILTSQVEAWMFATGSAIFALFWTLYLTTNPLDPGSGAFGPPQSDWQARSAH
jgi:hypothetical protein